MNNKSQIKNRQRAKLRLIEITLSGSFDAVNDVEETMTAFRYKSFGVERKSGLKSP